MTEGVPGVAFDRQKRKWRAYIPHVGKQLYLGLFPDVDEAIAARRAAEIEYGYKETTS